MGKAKHTPEGDFDHGGFWDQYSARWDREGDGDGVRHEGVLGVEWTDDAQTQGILERHVLGFLTPGDRVLEIGPGGGKFSRLLEPRCKELILADISQQMLERAAASCAKRPATLLLDGRSLEPLESSSVDMVFSYDVFIHLESEEIFRYFAEINRVLKPRGVFVVQTSTFESRFGFLSFLRQIRDHSALLGSRYGGRMYPMSKDVVLRFADHSGFTPEVSHSNWEDRDLAFTFRKTRPAHPWHFISEPRVREHVELCERVGGTDRRELYAVNFRKGNSQETALLGSWKDPFLRAAGEAKVPAHACLASPLGCDDFAGVGLVRYPSVRGVRLSRLLEGVSLPLAHAKSLRRMMAELCDGLLAAHAAGLVVGEPLQELAVLHVEGPHLVLFGLVDPRRAGHPDPAAALAFDFASVATILHALPRTPAEASEFEDAVRALRTIPPSRSTLEHLRDRLAGE